MFLLLVIATGVLLCSLLFFGLATSLIVRVAVRFLPEEAPVPGHWKIAAVMMIVTFITAAAHVAEIALWTIAFLLCGAMTSFESAFYFSAVNYTSLGYGDIVLSQQWRLLGPLEALNGLLLVGVSTAVMFTVLSRLIAGRLRRPSSNGPG
jgi:hypothetical protein